MPTGNQLALSGTSSVPYTGLDGSLRFAPNGFLGVTSIEANFLAAFNTVLDVDGKTMEFAFSDGVTTSGRIHALIRVLWVTDETVYPIRHSHQFNTVVFQSEQKLQMLASSVPDGARLFANDYLDISDPCSLIMTSYKIVTSILKTGIITLSLNVMGSSPVTTSGIS